MRTNLGCALFIMALVTLEAAMALESGTVLTIGLVLLAIALWADLRSPAAHRASPARRHPRVVAKVGRHDANPARP